MNKFGRSWALLKSSLSVIARNKTLLVFPIVIFTLTSFIMLFFLAPVALRPTGHSYLQAEHWEAIGHSLVTQTEKVDATSSSQRSEFTITPGAAGYLAVMYFVSMFFATFFNVAFYHEILAALSGDSVSVARGLRFACTRWKAVLMWTLFAGLVGMIIKAIEQRLSWVGQIIAGFIGLAWSIAAVFVIPIIVREEKNANPLNLLKQSAYTLKRTWGEALIGYVGLGFINGVVFLTSLVFLIGAVFASVALKSYWLIAVAGGAWVVGICLWGYLSSVASQIYKGALYLYAAEGVVPGPYSEEVLNGAWKFKKA